jgi:N-acetylglucosaminyl-diphospho-decaprenol L-rhamnosyltransferase
MDDLAVVIVSWNCREYLAGCLESLRTAGPRGPYKVYVVDNCSSDGTVELVRREFPEVRLIANRENVGFAAANNQAIRESRSRYILLLNPDTTVLPGAVDGLVAFMDSHPEVSAGGPTLLNTDGTTQRTGVRFPSNWNIFCESLFLDRIFPQSKIFGRHKELYADSSKPREVDFVHGAALMARRKAVEKIGGLDEGFFMYFEETDWCWRMKAEGGKVYYSAGEGIVHHGGSETGHFDERRLVHYHASLLGFYEKHYSRLRLIMLRPLLVLRSIIRIMVWAALYAVIPDRRKTAVSCIRGYSRVVWMALGASHNFLWEG